MRKTVGAIVVFTLCLLLPAAALAASAKVTVLARDEAGAKVDGALFIFSLVDDPEQSFTVGESDGGRYEHSVSLPAGAASWNLTQVVATGFLPVKVSIEAKDSAGNAVQQVADMALDPGTPVPAIQTAPGGSVQIDLTFGDQGEVMARFMDARRKARAEAEAKAAAQADSAIKGAYAEALKLYNAGDVEGSLPQFRQAIEENPDDEELRLTYVRVLYQAKQYDEFETEAAAVLVETPGNTELIMMLYTGRRERGDLSGALEAVLMLKELGASGSDLLPHLDYLAKSMGRKTAAIPAYEALLEISPDDRDACVAMATIYGNMGKFKQSDQYLERAIALDPAKAPALYYDTAARLVSKQQPSEAQLQRAIDLLTRSIELQPNSADAYKTLGVALVSMQEPSEVQLQRVIDLLTRSIDQQPGLADAYKALGIAQWKAGDVPGAQQNLAKYLELNPDADDRATVEKWLKRLAGG